MTRTVFDIPYYHDYISPALAAHLFAQATPVPGVEHLSQVGPGGGLETKESLAFLAELYRRVGGELASVLARRIADRRFVDERVKACYELNTRLGRDFLDPDYQTVLGLEDANGRIVVGPKTPNYCRKGGAPVAPIPDFLQGPHVTLFGPPDSAKMAINAMNAYHRKLKGEPAIVEELLESQDSQPKWGADNEDSKTPLRADLVDAAVNLTACFEGELSFQDPHSGKSYDLARDHLAAPIKRFPGLALPSTFLFYDSNPIPLHLYDFAVHFFHNWHNPRALVFYVPKLENEEEAAYIRTMIATAEEMIQARHPSYKPGTVRLMIVLENPRAILRAHEIMDELHPYFLGASLGWHDYLGSTARLFKEDGNYRIPVKADPDIVIKYIKASHLLLADVVGSRGGVKVGGMYGILPLTTEIDSSSFQVTLKGFFKDVITQMKRDLTGYWVAHPDFVRLGLAIVEAWRLYKQGNDKPLFTLTREILKPEYREEVDAFIRGADIKGLDLNDPQYVRSLLVADIKESDFIANNHPDEIRYNVFQSLQYLTDWLAGNGCVALPTIIAGQAVRVMDDLATAERSRWEVWHEIRHGRFAVEDFLRIAHEEMHFIRKDLSNDQKIVQVKWDDRTAKWYPIAFRLMLQLMTAKKPAEFATELLMPFTIEGVRNAEDPWAAMLKIDAPKYALDPTVERFNYFFEMCGCQRFATALAKDTALDFGKVESLIRAFSVAEIGEAARFHGDIGEGKASLDAMAAAEQARVFGEEEQIKNELRTLGAAYRERFGFKFLISAKGKTGSEMLQALKSRMANDRETEIANAREALWQITEKRLRSHPIDGLQAEIEALRKKYEVTGVALAIARDGAIQSLPMGHAAKGGEPVHARTLFEIASLSKTVASAFALEYFRAKSIPLATPVNALLATTASAFRIVSGPQKEWADKVTLQDLMSHGALNMHYVKGIPSDRKMPAAGEILQNPAAFGYEPLAVANEPGTTFKYSGGGFMVLEHLIEALEGTPIQELTKPFLARLGLEQLTFEQANISHRDYASGYRDSGDMIPTSRFMFPAFAAGAMSSADDMMKFLVRLGEAYQNLEGSGPISHDTAVTMLFGTDRGCRDFMACTMGLGVFVAEAGPNKVAIHQGANDGFRAIYLYCFDGPDYGKGFTVLCNADNRGVIFIAEVAQRILRALNFAGIHYEAFAANFDFKGLKQEEIVNQGYKKLLFSAFEPTLPDEITDKGPVDPLADRNVLVGAKILSVTNQKFARAENLISPRLPKFDPELFCAQGKVMDSWETARHNPLPCDVLELEIAAPKRIRYAQLSTQYHDGNHAAYVRILARETAAAAWQEIIPKTKMAGHASLKLDLGAPHTAFRQFKVENYPDGGFSRLGLYEELPAGEAAAYAPLGKAVCHRFDEAIPKSKKPLSIGYQPTPDEVRKNLAHVKPEDIDYACAAFGGRMLKATNEHYGPAAQVLSPYPPLHMFDGLESARSREPGHVEEVTIGLGKKIRIERIVCDFTYFVNNNPLHVSFEGVDGDKRVSLVEKTKVKAFAAKLQEFRVTHPGAFDQIIVRAYPDGGINRIHVYGA